MTHEPIARIDGFSIFRKSNRDWAVYNREGGLVRVYATSGAAIAGIARVRAFEDSRGIRRKATG